MSGKRFGKMGPLLASTALMTPTLAERSRGRFMRAPDGHDDAEFREFEEAGEVEVGESDKSKPAAETDQPEKKPRAKPKPPKPAVQEKPIEKTTEGEHPDDDDDEDGDDEGDEGEKGEKGDGDKPAKPRQKASDRIRDLNRRLREEQRGRQEDRARYEAEKTGLPPKTESGKGPDIGEKPDPTDAEKYPLGHLDERYVEDSMDWRMRKHAAQEADAALQRQQQTEQEARLHEAQERLLGQVDEIAAKGSEIADDFQEKVVDTALKGEWRLEQTTFEAAVEAEHGAQILMELSEDKDEAARVAGLSPFQQLRFVEKRNAEIAADLKPRRKPSAPAPAKTTTTGANSRVKIAADTDNLDDFEKAWKADEKAHG